MNPATTRPYADIQGAVERAARPPGLDGIWGHDLRRSFVTLARRSGLPRRRWPPVRVLTTEAAIASLRRELGTPRADRAPSHIGTTPHLPHGADRVPAAC